MSGNATVESQGLYISFLCSTHLSLSNLLVKLRCRHLVSGTFRSSGSAGVPPPSTEPFLCSRRFRIVSQMLILGA